MDGCRKVAEAGVWGLGPACALPRCLLRGACLSGEGVARPRGRQGKRGWAPGSPWCGLSLHPQSLREQSAQAFVPNDLYPDCHLRPQVCKSSLTPLSFPEWGTGLSSKTPRTRPGGVFWGAPLILPPPRCSQDGGPAGMARPGPSRSGLCPPGRLPAGSRASLPRSRSPGFPADSGDLRQTTWPPGETGMSVPPPGPLGGRWMCWWSP